MNTPTTIEDALTYWESGAGRPYQGNLIDRNEYEKDPNNLGCMCAQGQVLVLSGKRTVEELLDGMDQNLADKEVAEVWNISTAHSILLRQVNDSVSGAPSIVITNPKEVLGDKWSKVLDFWWMLDGFDAKQWAATWDATWAATGEATWAATGEATGEAARAATWDATWAATWDATWAATWDATWAADRAATWAAARAAARAATEIQGFDLLDKTPFLSTFNISKLEDIPARPANYGNGFVPQMPE